MDQCPKCSLNIREGDIECPKCGLIYSKYKITTAMKEVNKKGNRNFALFISFVILFLGALLYNFTSSLTLKEFVAFGLVSIVVSLIYHICFTLFLMIKYKPEVKKSKISEIFMASVYFLFSLLQLMISFSIVFFMFAFFFAGFQMPYIR